MTPSSGIGTATEATVGPAMSEGAGPTASNTLVDQQLANTGAEWLRSLLLAGVALFLVGLVIVSFLFIKRGDHQ